MRKWINIQSLIEAAEAKARAAGQRQNASHISCITSSHKYCEPGYTTPESGVILFGNWNAEVTRREAEATKKDILFRLSRVLEWLDVEMEWEDEWTCCSECNGAVRTNADSYGWKRSYWQTEDCEIICEECVLKRPTDYLESLEGCATKTCTLRINLSEYGYHKLDADFEHGFHPGQDSDPKLVAKQLEELGVKRFVFTIDSVGQFDVNFSVHVHEEELEKAKEADLSAAKTDGPSVSQGLQRALQDASLKMGQLKGEGVRVAKCDASTGTADVKLVAQADFIAGKALD